MGGKKDRSPSRVSRSGVRVDGVLAENSGDCDREVRDSLSSVLPRQDDPAAGFKLALLALLALDALSGLFSLTGPSVEEGSTELE